MSGHARLDVLAHDVRLGVRTLRRDWRMALVVIVTLAMAIGPTAALYSALHALLIEPLPFPQASALVRVTAERGGAAAQLSYREVRDIRERLSGLLVFSSSRPLVFSSSPI